MPTSEGEPHRDIATAALSGNLTRDVELRELRSGTEVARLRVVIKTHGATANGGVEKPTTSAVETYGAQARTYAEYLGKGSRLVIEPELDGWEWADQEHNSREAVTFRALQVLFQGSRTEGRTQDTT